MTDYASGSLGAVVFPITASTTNPFLKDADPVLYHASNFFAAMIAKNLGARLLAEAALAGAPITAAVMQFFTWDPAPFLKELQAQLPLLAMFQIDEKYTEITLKYRWRTRRIAVVYVLPPMKFAQINAIAPELALLSAALHDRTELGMDPSYTPGSPRPLGYPVWKEAGVGQIELTDGSYGAYADTEAGLYFPRWSGTLTVSERSNSVASDFRVADGTEDTIALDPESGDPIDLVEDDTTFP